MDLIVKLLLGTIILMIVGCIVFFFIRHYKQYKKEKANSLAKEITDNKKEKDRVEQQRLGMELTQVLTKEVNKRTDEKYVIGYFPNNNKGKYFSILLRLVSQQIDLFQINISVAENNINIIDIDNSTRDYFLNQMEDVKKMLCEKIRAL